MVVTVTPCLGCVLLIAVVAECKSGNAVSGSSAVFELYTDLAGLTDTCGSSVRKKYLTFAIVRVVSV